MMVGQLSLIKMDMYFLFGSTVFKRIAMLSQIGNTTKPRKITSKDFHESLLPLLTRLQVEPALFNSSHCKFKLSTQQMQHFFFMHHQTAIAV